MFQELPAVAHWHNLKAKMSKALQSLEPLAQRPILDVLSKTGQAIKSHETAIIHLLPCKDIPAKPQLNGPYPIKFLLIAIPFRHFQPG